jgi:hypothetical protein
VTTHAALTRKIRAYLERRRDALNEEIRRYPTPIARCDVQLGALLEARAAVVALLDREPDDALIEGFRAAAPAWTDAEAQRLLAAVPVRPSRSSG